MTQGDGSATQVVRYRQVRRDRAVDADRRRGLRDLDEATAAAHVACRRGDHAPIQLTGRPRFCVWCGELG